MHKQRLRQLSHLFLSITVLAIAQFSLAKELPSWNEGKTKQSIIDFVTTVTNPKHKNYIEPADRIAVFDNDGTLWAEQPIYFQLFFAFDRIKQLAPQHPKWKTQEPFASILNGDYKKALSGGEETLITIIAAAQTGMSVSEFDQIVKQWISTAKHPVTQQAYTEMTYQPMLELLDYLRQHEFQTYIVSGGGIQFMRVWAESVYGIPMQQVIGSSGKIEFQYKNGQAKLMREPGLGFYNDKAGKVVGIYRHIGKQPVMAVGNSDGDLAMIQWTMSGEGKRFAMYVHHTDERREWAYDRNSHIGQLNKGLDQAIIDGWAIADMKKDWKVIYKFQK